MKPFWGLRPSGDHPRTSLPAAPISSRYRAAFGDHLHDQGRSYAIPVKG